QSLQIVVPYRARNRLPLSTCRLLLLPADDRSRFPSKWVDQKPLRARIGPVREESEICGWVPWPTRSRRTDAPSTAARDASCGGFLACMEILWYRKVSPG